MTLPVPARAVLLAGVAFLALSAGACGRRGPLEPPAGAATPTPAPAAAPAPTKPARAVPADRRLRPSGPSSSGVTSSRTTLATDPGAVVENTPDDDDEDEEQTALTVSPSPTPKKRVRAFAVPNEPFILDPLL